MIFKKHKIIFIHNPKSGGSSVSVILNGQGDNLFLGWHCPWKEHEETLSKEIIQSYNKVIFIRNPWDRLVSAFEWYKTGGVKSKRDLIIQKSIPNTFTEFVKDIEKLSSCEIPTDNPPYHKIPHFLPQIFMMGNTHYDFIGRFENFQNDVFKIFQNKLKIKFLKIPNINKKNKKDYRYYYNNYTSSKIKSIFSEDIKNFEYSFKSKNFYFL